MQYLKWLIWKNEIYLIIYQISNLQKNMSVCIPSENEDAAHAYFAKRREIAQIIRVYQTDPNSKTKVNTTYILNAKKIATQLNRDMEHLQLIISMILRTNVCQSTNQSLKLNNFFNLSEIEECINEYIHNFVVCTICSSATTRCIQAQKLIFCTGCGNFTNFFQI